MVDYGKTDDAYPGVSQQITENTRLVESLICKGKNRKGLVGRLGNDQILSDIVRHSQKGKSWESAELGPTACKSLAWINRKGSERLGARVAEQTAVSWPGLVAGPEGEGPACDRNDDQGHK